MPSSRIPKRPSSKPPSVTPSEELQRLRCGELTANEYLQFRIEQATLHLRGRVSNRRLERIRRLVVEACANDPVLQVMKARLLGLRR
jgi:hypothetical protein